MSYLSLKREETLKNAVRDDYFKYFKYINIGDIDFVITKKITEKKQFRLFEDEDQNICSILWAEAKLGTEHDLFESFVQLILTIGKGRIFEKYSPPKYIGAFDAEKFAFIEYYKIQQIFYQNDFNWNVTPSNHKTKEFTQLYKLCQTALAENTICFYYATQSKELKMFIATNFNSIHEITQKIPVTKNNFTFVFQRWSEVVKPTISVNWEKAKKTGIISADFFLADLLSNENESLKDSLYVVLKKTKYELAKKINDLGFETSMSVGFNDKQKAYKEFWSVYSRPPKEEYWDYIIGRRDLLVPQDIREEMGAFFTPQIWVQKSQEYLASTMGENWQDEYYIWDCCAGTGNLLNGLTNKRNIWASTIDKADVNIMNDMINNGFNLFEDHVFQFDFLNDSFIPQRAGGKLPNELFEIISNPKNRKKLIVYINPPYKEPTSSKTISNNKSRHISGVAKNTIQDKYQNILIEGSKELFILFLYRCYVELKGVCIANFSKIKILLGLHYKEFRNLFQAKLKKMFIVPAKTFDNVTSTFPIGFFIWDTNIIETFEYTNADIYDQKGLFVGHKRIIVTPDKNIKDWLRLYNDSENFIGWLVRGSADIQNNNIVFITSQPSKSVLQASNANKITARNLIINSIFLAVRRVIADTWINDRDQYLFPNQKYEIDVEFQLNCLIYSLFADSNTIKSEYGINYWIPFTEEQIGCKKAFQSNFMSNFLKERIKQHPLSIEAQAVYNAGLKLWQYYHSQSNANPNASYYDIKKYFQGVNDKGKMKNSSNDKEYTMLIGELREKMKTLAKKIEPKVYEYGFLR